MSSHITDFLYFIAGLFFISLTSFTNVSSTQLGNDVLLDSTNTEYRSLPVLLLTSHKGRTIRENKRLKVR
ncbi:MAG: hypothetical protein L3J75_17660 [Methylococcaceae bacterium]|nr:hypothetical protein [Methylococcaceae bacterium]